MTQQSRLYAICSASVTGYHEPHTWNTILQFFTRSSFRAASTFLSLPLLLAVLWVSDNPHSWCSVREAFAFEILNLLLWARLQELVHLICHCQCLTPYNTTNKKAFGHNFLCKCLKKSLNIRHASSNDSWTRQSAHVMFLQVMFQYFFIAPFITLFVPAEKS